MNNVRRQRRFFGLTAVVLLLTPIVAAASVPSVAISTVAVSKAVASGVKVTGISPALKPNLSDIGTDMPTGFDCSLKARFCNAGSNSAAKKIVVFGDSHAAMWFSSLSAGLSSKYHLLLRWKASCPAAAVTVRDTGYVTGADCNEWRRTALSQTIADHPSAVIIAERTSTDVNTAPVVRTAAQWKKALLVTLQELHRAHIRTIVLGDNPTFARSPAACVAAHLDAVNACNVAIGGRGDLGNFARAERAAAADVSAKFIPTDRLFCTPTLCPPIVDNVFVYHDNLHMTQTYSIYLSKVIAKLTGL